MDYKMFFYIFGFVVVAMYLILGIDDFVWDIWSIIRRIFQGKKRLNLNELEAVPTKLLAVSIAAWHEDNVLGDVIDNLIESTIYPRSMYHIFLGVYPNDEPTIATAEALARRHGNVHVIINNKPGPTSKAQNINYVITQIREFEREHGWKFASLTIHDSEDVVHPYELKATNQLIDKYKALQFPVFPLIPKPTFGNFFKNITSGTYADEFAENHYVTVVNRCDVGAFVPSAGTGFALSREVLDIFGDDDVLPADSLTEDYRLSLTLYEKGIQMRYVLESVPRVSQENKLEDNYIATRSMFPNTFKTAVKQKTRWILGITMQSLRFRDIFKTKGLRLTGRYSMYKDYKAKIGNLLSFLGYPVLIYFFVSLFTPLTPIYPFGSPSWYLSIAVTILMIIRQTHRAFAIFNIYGMRSVFFACLFPPILPIRLVWGNIINFVSTVRAYRQNIFGQKQPKDRQSSKTMRSGKKKQLAWAKTDHSFLSKDVLKRFHRNLGDALLEKGYITPRELQIALEHTKPLKHSIALKHTYYRDRTLGSYLIDRKMITEKELLTALSQIKHIEYFDIADSLPLFNFSQFAPQFEQKLLEDLAAVPVLRNGNDYVFAFCDSTPMDAQTRLRKVYGITLHPVFSEKANILAALEIMYESTAEDETDNSVALNLYHSGRISYEQVLIAYKYMKLNGKTETEMLEYLGLVQFEPSS